MACRWRNKRLWNCNNAANIADHRSFYFCSSVQTIQHNRTSGLVEASGRRKRRRRCLVGVSFRELIVRLDGARSIWNARSDSYYLCSTCAYNNSVDWCRDILDKLYRRSIPTLIALIANFTLQWPTDRPACCLRGSPQYVAVFNHLRQFRQYLHRQTLNWIELSSICVTNHRVVIKSSAVKGRT